MAYNPALEALSKEQLMELVTLYSKNWLALDGVWFQSVEQKLGMDEAMEHDENAWARFTRIEARRIREFLQLPPFSGLEGLKQALALRFYANLNRAECQIQGNTLLYRLKRIGELTGLDLEKEDAELHLLLSFRILKQKRE